MMVFWHHTSRLLRVSAFSLSTLLVACAGQPPLPIEPETLRQELTRRILFYRQVISKYEAEGTSILTDHEGRRSASNWLLSVQGTQDFSWELRSQAEDEPILVLQANRDMVAVRLHAPGGREAILYKSDRAQFESLVDEPRLAPLRLLLNAQKALLAPPDFLIENVTPRPQDGELLVQIRSSIAATKLRLRREDAMPVLISASLSGRSNAGCLEISFPNSPPRELEMAADKHALRLPTEAVLTWMPCCTGQNSIKLHLKLRAFRLSSPSQSEATGGKTLPLQSLAKDRLWNEFIRGFEQSQRQNPSTCQVPPSPPH